MIVEVGIDDWTSVIITLTRLIPANNEQSKKFHPKAPNEKYLLDPNHI